MIVKNIFSSNPQKIKQQTPNLSLHPPHSKNHQASLDILSIHEPTPKGSQGQPTAWFPYNREIL